MAPGESRVSKSVFISHVGEEAQVAIRLKEALERDFLGFLNVFVSSDATSIEAGEEWLKALERGLNTAAILVVLCSLESVAKPWVNFEAGAAWIRGIPIIPVCHAGMTPEKLPMPLSLRQGVLLNSAAGLQRLYQRVAESLHCRMPPQRFESLGRELAGAASTTLSSEQVRAMPTSDPVRERLMGSLADHRHRWRSLERVAFEAALTPDAAAAYLRVIPEVRFGKGRSGEVIVGLVSRVGKP